MNCKRTILKIKPNIANHSSDGRFGAECQIAYAVRPNSGNECAILHPPFNDLAANFHVSVAFVRVLPGGVPKDSTDIRCIRNPDPVRLVTLIIAGGGNH